MASADERSLLLELETRRKIYDHISRVPGLHMRALQRELDLPFGTVEYNLRQMELHGLIVVRNESRRKAYFVDDKLDRRDRDLLYWLRQKTPCRITLEILSRPGITFTELKPIVPVSPSTMSWHLKKLVSAEVVQEEPYKRTKRYEVTEPERTKLVLIKYQKTFGDEVVDRFSDAWLDLGL